MKPSAAIIMALILALWCPRTVLGADAGTPAADAGKPAADAGKPEVVDIPEQELSAPDKGASIAEIPRAQDSPSEERPASDSSDQGAYDQLSATPPSVPDLHSLREFLDQMSESSSLGIELREDQAKLKNGDNINGLAVLSVAKDSPAARAGLQAYSGGTHVVLEGATMAAALVFPPAIVALTIIDQTHVGESYDLIIGVDGTRVSDLMEFEDRTRTLRPGDIVYLNVVRSGVRRQIPVSLPPMTQASK
ncbi:MAG: PDZ domain-containing protein [Candidatus Binataceae bacterium]|jgi:hypothetical protein